MKKLIILLSTLFFLLGVSKTFGQSNHLVIVLDASLSTSNNRTFYHSQSLAIEVIKLLQTEDVASIFSFDARTIKRIDKSDEIEKIVSSLNSIKPFGIWTNTALMLKEVTEFIEKQNSVRLFIFSDGKDDQPSNSIISRFNQYDGKDSHVFYLYYLNDDELQRKLVTDAFPNTISKKISTQVNPSSLARELVDYYVPRITMNFDGFFDDEVDSGKGVLNLNILANKALAGKDVLVNIGFPENLFKNFSAQGIRTSLTEGNNSLSFPYFIPYQFNGQSFDVKFTAALADDPLNPIVSKDVKLKVLELFFFEKMYLLPSFYIPISIVLLIILFIIYRIIRYQLFIPFIEMSYWFAGKNKDEDESSPNKNKMDFGVLENGKYKISSKADSFLVLPELSTYNELILIKKGKKFKTKLLIKSETLRNIIGVDGVRIKKKVIKNNTSFKLGDYIFSFRVNLDRGKKIKIS